MSKQNTVRCVGLFAILTIILIATIKSKDLELESLESVNTALESQIKTLENDKMLLNEEIEQIEQKSVDSEPYIALTTINYLKDVDKYTWFKLYYHVLFEQYELDDLPETPYDVFTDEQINIMLKCIETETHEASFESKVNVANVILNRVEHEEYPTDPVDIITGTNQFKYGRNNIDESTRYALLYAFMIEDTTDGCIAFRSDSSPATWNGWAKQFTDESGHTFYK